MRIQSGTPVLYLSLSAASMVTIGLAGTFFYLMWLQGKATILFVVFITPFLLMGMLLGYFGTRGLLRLLRYGSWELDLPDEGGRLGVPLHTRLLPRREIVTVGEIECRLRCVRSVRTRVHGSQGKSGHADHDTLWEDSWRLRAGTIHPNLGLELGLTFPSDGEPTAVDRHTGSGIVWQLNVIVPAEGHIHEAMFEIPVRAN